MLTEVERAHTDHHWHQNFQVDVSESLQEPVLRLARLDVSLEREEQAHEDGTRFEDLAHVARHDDSEILDSYVVPDSRAVDRVHAHALVQ